MPAPLLLSEPTGVDPTGLFALMGLGALLVGLAWWVGLRLVRRPAGWQVAVGSLLVALALVGTAGAIWLVAALMGIHLEKIPVDLMLLWLIMLGTPGYWLLARRLSRQAELTSGQRVLRGVWISLALLGTLLAVLAALDVLTRR